MVSSSRAIVAEPVGFRAVVGNAAVELDLTVAHNPCGSAPGLLDNHSSPSLLRHSAIGSGRG